MERPFDQEDSIFSKLVKEAGTEKPSADFKDRLMHAIEPRDIRLANYSPLISRKGWILITIIASALVIALFMFNGQLTTTQTLLPFNYDFPELSLPTLEISKTALYAIGFLGLFLLQVPLLRRFVFVPKDKD